MRMKHLVNVFSALLVLLFGAALTGCAGLTTGDTENVICTSTDIGALLQSGEYRKKVDNFLILQDASTSMSDDVERCFSNEISKLQLSQALIKCLNSNLPDDFDVYAGMRVFGAFHDNEGLIYGMTEYSKSGLDNAANALTVTGGNTPIATALYLAADDLQESTGKTAVILFSDGLNSENSDPVAAAAAMKKRYGDNICIYGIITGKDAQGTATMNEIAKTSECGFAIDADSLHDRPTSGCSTTGNPAGMPDFVKAVFLEPTPRTMTDLDSDGDGITDNLDLCPNTPPGVQVDRVGCPLDLDGDGVLDTFDRCPNTPRGIKVDSTGCPTAIPEKVSLTLQVEFDFDKAEVRSEYHSDIEKVANFLKAYPDTSVKLEGHTDSLGTEEYNLDLSVKRAQSVKSYLIENFSIDPDRISAVGYGESQPVSSNETEEGRQRNRRVVATIVTTVMR